MKARRDLRRESLAGSGMSERRADLRPERSVLRIRLEKRVLFEVSFAISSEALSRIS